MSKHKYSKDQQEKQKVYKKKKLTLKNMNRTFNLTEIILIVSIFNALFYLFGLDVGPAIGVIVILFPLVFVVYIVYKLMNRRKQRQYVA